MTVKTDTCQGVTWGQLTIEQKQACARALNSQQLKALKAQKLKVVIA
jgi:hypothetical protein